MLTVSALDAFDLSSVTTSENVRVTAASLAPRVGAVKVGPTAVELDKVTVVPAVCVQA